MSIKVIILAAATIASTASFASASTYFDFGPKTDASAELDLGLITSANAATVEVYDFHKGTQGDLLGAKDIRAGANVDVRVNTGAPTTRNVIALVKVDGEVVASKVFDVVN